jgi:hypothetical protein
MAKRLFSNQQDLYYTINDHLDEAHPLRGIKFYNKMAAMDAAKSAGVGLESMFFHWLPSTWESLDFTKEPSESYEELKKQRALKLREKYKYIRLFFSGGSDSISALNAFLKNGIHLDEIVNYNRGSRRYRYIDPDNEVKLSARAYLESIKHLIPNTKITYKTMTGQDLVNYNISLDKAENDVIGFGEAAEFEFIPDHKHLYIGTDPSTTCNLEGGQKPMLFLVNGGWYFGTMDVCNIGFYNNAEEFFLDPEDPRLFLKTVHRLKEFAQTTKNIDREKFVRLFTQRNKLEHRKTLLEILGRDTVHHNVSLIKFRFFNSISPIIEYKGNKINYPYPKTLEIVRNAVEDVDFSSSLDRWFGNIQDITRKYENFMVYDKTGILPMFGFKNIYSDLYNIETGSRLSISPIKKGSFVTLKDVEFSCLVL